MFTWDQVSGLLRQVLPFIGGFAVARGWINAEQLAQYIGAIITVGGVIWALVANSKSSIIASATAMPEVDSKKLAAAIDDPKLKDVAANGA